MICSLALQKNTEQQRAFLALKAAIDEAQTIAICGHTSPDGDALGSVLGLYELIQAHWKGKELFPLLADDKAVPKIYHFLPGSEDLRFASACKIQPDLFIALDLSVPKRLAHAEDLFFRAKKRAILDHHPAPERISDLHYTRPAAASAGLIVAEFALYLNEPITRSMATNLLCSLITDTGRFQYQNTNPEAFEVASRLLEAGASPAQISLEVYQSYRLEYLHLKSTVLGRIATFENGRFAYSYTTLADLQRTGAEIEETEGLVDLVRSTEGSEVALFLKEVPGGSVRGNLRSKGDLDISVVAEKMGGGGHRAASGFSYQGSVDEAFTTILPLIHELMSSSS